MHDSNHNQTNSRLVPLIVAIAACVIGIAVFVLIASRRSMQSAAQDVQQLEMKAEEQRAKMAAASMKRDEQQQQAVAVQKLAMEQQAAEIDRLRRINAELQAQVQEQAQAQAEIIPELKRDNVNDSAAQTNDQGLTQICSKCQEQRTITKDNRPSFFLEDCPKATGNLGFHTWMPVFRR